MVGIGKDFRGYMQILYGAIDKYFKEGICKDFKGDMQRL